MLSSVSIVCVGLIVIAFGGGRCSLLSYGKQRSFTDDNCANNGTPPSIPAWPDQFISNFHLYIEKLSDNFQSNGAVIYDWTNKVCKITWLAR